MHAILWIISVIGQKHDCEGSFSVFYSNHVTLFVCLFFLYLSCNLFTFNHSRRCFSLLLQSTTSVEAAMSFSQFYCNPRSDFKIRQPCCRFVNFWVNYFHCDPLITRYNDTAVFVYQTVIISADNL